MASKTYNELHDFTRKIPSYLSKKQMERDAKIAKQIVMAHDVEHNKEKMLGIFFAKHRLLSNPRYWEILRTVWVAAGDASNVGKFRELMKSARPARSWFMTPEDKESFDSFAYPITLWRAYTDDDDHGISWSSSKEWVEIYAAIGGRKIKSKEFRKEDIFAYISRRGEDEFIIL